MKDYKKIATSAEVWAVLKARHGSALRVYGSHSAPEGDHMGDPTQAVMMTEYGFEGGRNRARYCSLCGAMLLTVPTSVPTDRPNQTPPA